MFDQKQEIDFMSFDPFTLSEYENLIRLVRIYGLQDPGLLEQGGESFVLKKDLTVDEHLSARAVFTIPYDMKESSISLRVRKDSFYLEPRNLHSRIDTETTCRFILERYDRESCPELPDRMSCLLTSQNSFVEKSEATLLSKKKTFVEKTYRHILTVTEFSDGTEDRLLSDDNRKIYETGGFSKVDAATGWVVEERSSL